jgi:predicted 3-demethylubiquinone-9 3-methyltransferase (glyoxalase superfamily)
MKPKNTICLWFGKGRGGGGALLRRPPDSEVTSVHAAPVIIQAARRESADGWSSPLDIPFRGLNGGLEFRHTEAFSFQIATENQQETDCYWNTIVGSGGTESACSWCGD